MAAWGIVARRRYGVRFFASGFSKKWFLQPQSLVDLAAVTPGILQAFGVGGELLQGSRILRILRLLRLIRCVPPHTHTHTNAAAVATRCSVCGCAPVATSTATAIGKQIGVKATSSPSQMQIFPPPMHGGLVCPKTDADVRSVGGAAATPTTGSSC